MITKHTPIWPHIAGIHPIKRQYVNLKAPYYVCLSTCSFHIDSRCSCKNSTQSFVCFHHFQHFHHDN